MRMPWVKTVGDWLDARVGFRASILPMLTHPIPRGAAGRLGWWYVFGSASMTLLAVQVLTGILLALVYVPTADEAYNSLLYLDYEWPLGWLLRAIHYYAGSGMVVMVLVHMAQVFLHGAYKYPRELTWVAGVFLLLCTLGMFFSGQVLRWDPDAYWGLAVAGSMAGRVPVLGPMVVRLVLGGPVIGGDSLSRFFTLHVFVIPGTLLLFLGLHLWLVLTRGISAPPVPGRPVDPGTYDAEYEEELRQGVPFLGDAMLKDALFSALAVITVVVLAAWAGPKGPTALPDPALGGANPRPEWPFLWLFALLSLSPAGAETFIILVFPAILIAVLLAVPFVSPRGERAPSRRPVAVLAVIVIAVALVTLTYHGVTAEWSPVMTAWSAMPVPEDLVEKSTPLQLQGAVMFQNKNCRNCHALEGRGGRRGPDLTGVGTRLTRDQLIDQVSNGTPGGGNMPAYGKQINAAEMTALVEFLVSLRPDDQPPAQPASEPGGPPGK
jgi:ubiquinol-cytochrome c reductase cytochrome b subunit